MSYNNIRDYEVSVWTLQDSFITVLKGYGDENKGQIQKPNMGMKNDGTLTLTFSLPMYLYINAEKIENPKWYNVHNGTICADLRKIKVIFNKRETYEKVFEFVITKVTESHEKLQTWCEVECEALVFHELGRNGYKLSFHPEDFYTEWNEAQDKNNFKANINYWMDKVIANTEWQYEIAMTWDDYSRSRSTTKIYEDDYVSSWSYDSTNDIYVPQNVITDKEKERLIDIEESNRYNIIQELAEKFGVFARFEYQYDIDYHIIGKKIVFYNVAINESNPLTIHYSYNTDDIEREMDGVDTITKMYIKSLSDSYTESGYATVMDTEANKSGEDYLLNFDYLHEIKTITDEQYEYVKVFEKKVKQLNEQIKPLQKQLIYIEEQIIDKEAKKTFYENAVSLDKERISSNNKLLNNLTNGTGYVTIDNSRPDMLVFLYEAGKNKSKINIRQKGVYPASVKIYTNYNTSTRTLSGLINSFISLYDESGNLIGVEVAGEQSGYAYLTYKYSPRFYYENIIDTWERRLAQDNNNLDTIIDELNDLNDDKEDLNLQVDEITTELQQERNRFDTLMGSAIREGYWQPEDDYEKYGDRYSESLILNDFSNNLCSMGWDDELFDNEMKNYYESGITQNNVYYPCIDLSNNLTAFLNQDLSKISFIYKELTNAESGSSIIDNKFIQIDSGCFFRFLKHNTDGTVIPVLILTDTSIPSDIYDGSKNYNQHIGIVSIQIQNNTPVISETTILNNTITKTLFITPLDLQNYKIVYPRIQIQSANLKTSEDQFSISDSSGILRNYYDYYLLNRSINTNIYYYATINSNYIFSNKVKNINNYTCNFILSNSSLFIYLDAIKVLNENAYPKAEYTIATTLVDEEFMKTAYNTLNKLVRIYDLDLKFNGVQGYISELDLDLDKPWEDKITIANYKTKFEDLFSNIVVQTEEMKKNAAVIDAAARVFTIGGAISEDAMQQSINKADLNYAFNNGSLTIDENNGIWGTSDSGVVAMRGGGIFTATEKDDDGNWIWNTGILPGGINADLITTGQLDTNLIRIYAGDDLKLQMNGDGLFAYRDLSHMGETASGNSGSGLDYGQYVVHNGDGLFLRAEKNTEINNNIIQISGTDYNIISEPFNFSCYNGDLIFLYFPSEYHNSIWFTGSLVLNYRQTNDKYYEYNSGWLETSNDDYIALMDYIIDYFSDYLFLENKTVAYLRYNYTNTESVIINKLLKDYSYDYVIWFKPSTQIISIYYLDNNKIIKKEYGKLNTNVDRVAITWDGLTLRNWNNERTLWADADTGDLHIKGNLDAATGTFSGELSAATGTFYGSLFVRDGSVEVATITPTEISLNADRINMSSSDNQSFIMDANGAIMENLTITGKLNAPGSGVNYYTGTTNITIGSNNCTYQTLKECADDLNNKYLKQDITITLTQDFTTTSDVNFYGICGFGDITIDGFNYISNGEIIPHEFTGQIRIINCSSSFTIMDLAIQVENTTSPNIPIRSYGRNYIRLLNIQIYGVPGDNFSNRVITGIQVNYGGHLTISSVSRTVNSTTGQGVSILDGRVNCIQCSDSSFLYIENNVQISNEYVTNIINAYGSLIIVKNINTSNPVIPESHCLLKNCIYKFISDSDSSSTPTPSSQEGTPISTYVTPLKIWRRSDPEGWAQEGDTNYLQGSDKVNSWTDYHTCVWYDLSSYSGKTIKSATLTISRDTSINSSRNVTMKIYGMYVAYRSGRPSNDGWNTITSTVNPYHIANNVYSSVSIDITAAFQDMVNNNITGLAIGLDKTERDGTTWSSGNTTYSYNYAKFVTSNNFRIDFTYV